MSKGAIIDAAVRGLSEAKKWFVHNRMRMETRRYQVGRQAQGEREDVIVEEVKSVQV